MEFTIFGLLWLLVLAFLFISKTTCHNVYAAFYITLIAMILQCDSVIVLGGKGVGPQVVTSFFFIIYSLRLHPAKNNKKMLQRKVYIQLATWRRRSGFPDRQPKVAGLESPTSYSSNCKPYLVPVPKKQNIVVKFSLLLYGLLFLYMYLTASHESPLIILQLMVYVICAYRMFVTKSFLPENRILIITKRIALIVIVVGLFQFLASSGLFPKFILKPFFFNDDDFYVQFNWPQRYVRFMGTFMEPSFCSTFLVGMILMILHLKSEIHNSKIILIGLGLALIVTFSSTGYVSCLAMIAIYLILNRNMRVVKMFIPIIVFLGIFYILFKDTLLNEVLFNKMETGSGVARYYNNIRALEAFENNSLYGVGLNNERASSFAIGLIAETGIIGATIYSLATIILLYPVIKLDKYRFRKLEIASRLYLLSVLMCMLVAVPDMVLCTFWLGVYHICLTTDRKGLVKK